MPRRTLQPIPRSLASNRDSTFRRQNVLFDQGVWERLDQVQELGTETEGHGGCVNALSWSDDGSTLLSGSDDRRICIWGPDTNSSASSISSPHPLKLIETIATGHRANIFSARYLPNTSTPTIVTCAGDKQVRVFDVERLSRHETGVAGGSTDLYGVTGPGVTVLRCHHDRTKRIATENSPFLFLTVSEDGTVRQHDLRRPHQCKSECPEPLFHAPRGVDLYSLSVSTVTPHIFAVAGRTDCAFICDRRMPEHHSPSWGNNMKSSGQVHCVRRLGLPNYEWESVERTPEGRMRRQDRHITCVKMSQDKADEVICAFAGHSTALFSIHDDPSSTCARVPSPSPIATSSRPKVSGHTAADFLRTPLSLPPPSMPTIAEAGPSRLPATAAQSSSSSPSRRRQRSASSDPEDGSGRSSRLRLGGDEEDDRREMAMEADNTDDELQRLVAGFHDNTASDPPGSTPPGSAPTGRPPSALLPTLESRRRRPGSDDGSDGLEMYVTGGRGPEYLDLDMPMDDDSDDVSEDDDDEDDDMDEGVDEEDEDEYGGMDVDPLSDTGEFGDVEKIMPRRCYKGARNVRTVKDCNFLGAMSDKVASGSDDGNFFVWDKISGRLEGIWEGDGDTVNVMEQHPTLPLVAVSGIDNTIKMFGPLSTPLPATRSMIRTSDQDAIVQRNLEPRRAAQPMYSAAMLQTLANSGIMFRHRGGADAEEEGAPQCATQ